jgi:hypothetical protein
MRGAVVVAVAAAAVIVPGAAQAQSPPRDSVIGAGHVLSTDFIVSVQAGPNGENPTGFGTLSGFVNGNVIPTCLNVSGNTAVDGWRFVDGPTVGQGFISEVHDNGSPVNGVPVDTTIYNGYLPTAPTSCPAPGDPPPSGFTSVGAGPLTSGDVTVTDAPALPTRKDQCKNGGWRTFGVFKNQGDCVSFVATKGKNQPAGTG